MGLNQLGDVLRLHLTDVGGNDGHEIRRSLPSALDCQKIMHVLVCSHGSRDKRCGRVGSRVSRDLHKFALKKNLTNVVRVVECSHLGGHKVRAGYGHLETVVHADLGDNVLDSCCQGMRATSDTVSHLICSGLFH